MAWGPGANQSSVMKLSHAFIKSAQNNVRSAPSKFVSKEGDSHLLKRRDFSDSDQFPYIIRSLSLS